MPGYIRARWRDLTSPRPEGCRVWIMLADHYEPLFQKPGMAVARARVAVWQDKWPRIADRHPDSAGSRPCYTFFYPEDEYHPDLLDPLAKMAREGIGDVEIHIHHDREGEQNFVDRMSGFRDTLRTRHGLLRQHEGRTVFAFIHGNWALDNSLGGGKWCGLNNEIQILRRLGCYADFTMPCPTHDAQSRLVNTIYWATDDPARPKSYDSGLPVRPGAPGSGDLLMIPGPLGWRYRGRLVPRLESGELAHQDLVTQYRTRRWIELAPRIGKDIFIKLHTHGAHEVNAAALLGPDGLDLLYQTLAEECRRLGYTWYSVSAWQMRQAVAAAARLENPAAQMEPLSNKTT